MKNLLRLSAKVLLWVLLNERPVKQKPKVVLSVLLLVHL